MATTSSPALLTLERGESCAYLKPDTMTGCRAPRSCRSCLATAGCMIDFTGNCVSQQLLAYNPTNAYERAIADGLALPNATASRTVMSAKQSWLFPAGRVTYCDSSVNGVCRECTRANFYRATTSFPDSRFCVGESQSCVCIDVCERPWIVKPDCSTSGGRAPIAAPTRVVMAGATPDLSTARSIFYGFVGITIFAVLALGFVVRVRQRAAVRFHDARSEARRRRDEARREQRTAQFGVNPLSLTGWEAYRRDLIEKEAAQLAGTGGTEKIEHDQVTTAIASSVDTSDHEDDQGDIRGRQSENEAVYVRLTDDGTPQRVETTHEASTSSDLAALTPARPLLLAPLAPVPRQQPRSQ